MTISSWMKKMVSLCYELSYEEAQTLHKIRVHDDKDLSRQYLFGADFVSLSLEITQHFHSVLSERCGLG